MSKRIYTYSQIAREFGVRNETISDIVRIKMIPVGKHPCIGNAVAIDGKGYRSIKKAMAPATATTTASQPA